MKTGYKYSLMLHLALCLLCVINFPSLKKLKSEDTILTIEALTISDKTNVQKITNENNSKKLPRPQKEVKPVKRSIEEPKNSPKLDSKKVNDKEKPKLKETVKPKAVEVSKSEKRVNPIPLKSEETKVPEPSPPTSKEENIAEMGKNPEVPTIEEPLVEKKEERVNEQKEDNDKVEEKIEEQIEEKVEKSEKDFDSLFKDLAAQEDFAPSIDEVKKGANKENYNEDLPLSLSEKDAIKSQIMGCWSIPAGGKDAKDMHVVIGADVEEDGTIKNIEIKERSKYASVNEKFYEVFVESAIRALQKCSPLQGLPVAKYSSWKKLELYFDPRDLIY